MSSTTAVIDACRRGIPTAAGVPCRNGAPSGRSAMSSRDHLLHPHPHQIHPFPVILCYHHHHHHHRRTRTVTTTTTIITITLTIITATKVSSVTMVGLCLVPITPITKDHHHRVSSRRLGGFHWKRPSALIFRRSSQSTCHVMWSHLSSLSSTSFHRCLTVPTICVSSRPVRPFPRRSLVTG